MNGLKSKAGYVAVGLILAVAMTFTYFQLTVKVVPPATYEVLRETTAKVDVGTTAQATFTPMLSAATLIVAFLCACLTYGVTKRRSNGT
jgi:hypothetical protein